MNQNGEFKSILIIRYRILIFRTFVISEWDRKFVQQFTIREEKLFDIITVY
jgi:hypothetical protein